MKRDSAIARGKEETHLAKPAKGTIAHDENADGAVDLTSPNVSAKLENPLTGISLERLQEMGRAFAHEKGLSEYADAFAKGAMVAQDPLAFNDLPLLDDADRRILDREVTHKWDHPKALYFLVIMCSISAAVQGMDESVTNGANLFWAPQFGLVTDASEVGPDAAATNQWLLGLTAGAPYLACAVLGCWLTSPLNRYLGRRGTIFLTATVSFLACFWSAVTNSWQHLFVSRLVLGLGIGAKSATVPVYGAETAPPLIRGALVMQWQVWTAFGIMMGTASSLAFFQVPDPANITGLNWRIMLASAGVPAIAVMAQVYFCPESPRWLIGRGNYPKAFRSLRRLRYTDIQAARDLFLISALMEEEAAISTGRPAIVELFAVARNRRAALASSILMFMQQFCGINVIAYYSATIFREAGFNEISALGATLGFGALNWISAAPAVVTIDRYGRRALLMTTFPLMALFLFITAFAFYIPAQTARTGIVALGIYLHCIAYSPGMGPVPFTYSAEAYPLYIRETGMSLATAITWLFNFILALTFPRLLDAFTPTGAFCWYAAWNIFGFFATLLFMPETKSLTLEELDQVFSVPTEKHASYQLRQFNYFIKKYILRKNVGPKEQLYHWEGASEGREPKTYEARGETRA